MGRKAKEQSVKIQVHYSDEDIRSIIKTSYQLILNENAKMGNLNLNPNELLFNVEKTDYSDFIKTAGSQESWQQVKKAYDDDKISYSEYMQYAIAILFNYGKTRIAAKGRAMTGAQMDHLLSSVYSAVAMYLKNYDPYRAAPTTFFTDYIDQETGNEVSNSKDSLSKYYNTKAVKYDKVAHEIGYEGGFLDPNLSPEVIADITGDSLKTVIDTRSFKQNISISSLTATSENFVEPEQDIYMLPEDAVLAKEQTAKINETLGCLNKLESYILFETDYSDAPKSNRKLIAILNARREEFEEFLPKGKIDGNFINMVRNAARDKLRRNKQFKKYTEKKVVYSIDTIEQASVKDIENAILSGIDL